MTKPPQKTDQDKSRSGSSLLSKEDEVLWQQVTASVKPIDRRKLIHHSEDEPFLQALQKASAASRKKIQSLSQDIQKTHGPQSSRPEDSIAPSSKLAPELARFDHKLFRKLGAERVEIDARLDLHGFRQDQAYSALKSFLRRAQTEGFRHVLVITGKGVPKHLARDYEFGEERPGVLKRLVPEWLGEEDFRSLVVSYTTAPVQHGGEGALYVKVRRGR